MSQYITKDSLRRISPTIKREPDRSAAILCAALLDEQLDALLHRFLLQCKETEPLFRGDGPLGAFAARNRAALALGLIPKDLFKDIDRVRQIRNHFAHRIEGLAFGQPPIADIANALTSVQWILDHNHLGDNPIKEAEVRRIDASPRHRFEIAVGAISLTLDKTIAALVPVKEANPAFPYIPKKT